MKSLAQYTDPDDISQAYRMPDDGRTLRQVSLETNLSWTMQIKEIVSKGPEYKHLIREVGKDCADLLIEKQVFADLELIVHSYNRRLALKRIGSKFYKKPIIISDFDLFNLLKKINLEKTIIFKFHLNIRIFLISFFRNFSNSISKPRQVVDTEEPVIGIDITEGFFDKGSRGEIFWWNKSAPNPSQLMCVLQQGILYPSLYKSLNKANIAGVNIFRNSQFVTEDQLISLRKENSFFKRVLKRVSYLWINNKINKEIRTLKEPIINYPTQFFSGLSDGWLERRYLLWIRSVNWWKIFLTKNNVKLWLFDDEESIRPVIIRSAMDKVGGKTLFRQRSITRGYKDWWADSPAHIAFTFSSESVSYRKSIGNRNELIIPVGHVFGINKNEKFTQSKKIRENLKKKGAKFVIAFFDNACSLMQDITLEQTLEIYERLFLWLINNQEGGLIVKSKYQSLLKKISTDIPEIWNMAAQTGRLMVEENTKTLPIVLSKASDLTIGVNISTAAVEASIAGLMTLHYYPQSNGDHFLEKQLKNKVVFNDIDRLFNAVKEIQVGNKSYGNSSSCIKLIDEFSDGKGPERISKVINILLESDLSSLKPILRDNNIIFH